MSTSVVTIVHGRHEHLAAQHRSLIAGDVLPVEYVVVAMDDPAVLGWRPGGPLQPVLLTVPSDPLGWPLAAARNAGVARAVEGGADTVICLDVDCLAGPGLVGGYAEAVEHTPDVVWSGPVTYLPPPPPSGYALPELGTMDDPHPARPAPAIGEQQLGAEPDLFWSLSFAMHRDAWVVTGGFCEEYVGYGGEDTDFGQTIVASGLNLGWTGSARAYHQHHESHDPPVQHVDDILRNGRLFHDRWGRWPMTGWLEEFERRGLVRRTGSHWERVAADGRPRQDSNLRPTD
jgi:N-acetylglucosaminyl-diphospho-decaprenol L-rhamnosyltransferase